MAKVRRSANNETNQPLGFESLYRSFIGFVDRLDSSKRVTYSVVSLLAAAVLTVIASLTVLPRGFDFIYVVIGFPAGLLVFGNIVAYAYFSPFRNTALFEWKDRTLPARRLRAVVIGGAVIIAGLVVLNGRLPLGLGGVIVITAALIGFNLMRRTPEEIRLARAGLPDPRALVEDYEEDEESR